MTSSNNDSATYARNVPSLFVFAFTGLHLSDCCRQANDYSKTKSFWVFKKEKTNPQNFIYTASVCCWHTWLVIWTQRAVLQISAGATQAVFILYDY